MKTTENIPKQEGGESRMGKKRKNKKNISINYERTGDKGMGNVQIIYNPYMVITTIILDGHEIDPETSPLQYVQDKRLQEWIEPRGSWKGIYQELRRSTGEGSICIEFTGTFGDFEDLAYAKNKYGDCFKSVELIHKNKETAGDAAPYQKMLKLQELYDELQNGPVEEFKTEDIKKNFDTAINSDFKIVIVAPMSSGKSTLINAILGIDLLPAVNQATTAVITEIKDNDNMDHFLVSADDKYGNNVCKNEKADKKLITELNYKKDPNDPEKKDALIHTIQLEGPIPNLTSDILSTVFVDTPGGNNSQNTEHEEMMDEAIADENKSLILYVFNGAQLGTNDSNQILDKIATAMKNSNNGKQSRDRFLFVANRMDEYDVTQEPYQDAIDNIILPQLALKGITEPNLFLISAQATKLIRMYQNQQKLSETEEENLDTSLKRFNRESRMLPKFASLNASDREELINTAKEYITKAEMSEKALAESLKEIQGENYIEIPVNYKSANRLKAAEINSGVPALEKAIQKYLDKYAIAIKIKTVHDAFMRKVYERQMIDNCRKEWAESEEKFNSVKQELQEKQEKYNKEEKLQEYKEKVEKIQFDDSAFLESLGEIQLALLKLRRTTPEKIQRKNFEYTFLLIQGQIEKIGENAIYKLEQNYNDGIKRSCENIYKQYEEYTQNLQREGFLKIGAFDVSKTDSFSVFKMEKAEDLIQSKEYVTEERVKVGQTKIKKQGVFAAVKRLFGTGGFQTIDVYEDQEFVNMKEMMENQITQIQNEYREQIEELVKQIKNNVDDLKRETKDKLNGLDKTIKQSMLDIDKMLDSQEKLQKKVKDNEEKTKWIEEFVQKVDDLLSI